MISMLFVSPEVPQPMRERLALGANKYFFSELFAGEAAVSKEFANAGYPVCNMDREYGKQFDINSDLGFVNTLTTLLQTEVAVLMAPVCSTFVPVNKGTAMRSLGSPLGNPTHANNMANRMMNRVILLMWMMSALGICFIVEQPKGSYLQTMPRFQTVHT